MSRPRKGPARRKRSAAARVRPFWILVLLAICAAAAGGYYLAVWPGFAPKRVAVIGNRRVSRQAIIARAAIDRHVNLWLQNMGAAAARIVTIADIKDVAIHRALPAQVLIVVSERVPYAILQSGRSAAVVDSELRVLRERPEPGLPRFIISVKLPAPGAFLKDERVRHLRADYGALAAAHVAVASLRYDRFGDLVASTPRGVQILLGDDEDLSGKIPLIGPILAQSRGRRLAAVDLRAPATPVVVYR